MYPDVLLYRFILKKIFPFPDANLYFSHYAFLRNKISKSLEGCNISKSLEGCNRKQRQKCYTQQAEVLYFIDHWILPLN